MSLCECAQLLEGRLEMAYRTSRSIAVLALGLEDGIRQDGVVHAATCTLMCAGTQCGVRLPTCVPRGQESYDPTLRGALS